MKATNNCVLWIAVASLLSCTSAATRKEIQSAEDATFAPPLQNRGIVTDDTSRPSSTEFEASTARDDVTADTLELAFVQRTALARHPSLAEARHRVRALVEGARAEGSLPPPEFMADLWQVPLARPYAVDDAGMLMLSLRQEIPAPGSLDGKARAGALEARAASAMLIEQARELLREVAVAYADYVAATAIHRAHVEHLALIEQMRAAASARYAVRGALSDITRADLEKARVHADLARDRGRLEQAKARMNGLMVRPPGAPLGPPNLGRAETVKATLPGLSEDSGRNNPAVQRAELMRSAARQYAGAADTEKTIPSFAVGLSYFHPVGEMPAGWGASFGMSLPWLWGEASHRSRSAEERARAEASAADVARLRVRTDVARALAEVKATEQRFLYLRDDAVPTAARAVEATRAGYATGGSDLLMWLDTQRSALEVAIELSEARGDLERALAELDAVVGQPVPRTPIPAPKPNQVKP